MSYSQFHDAFWTDPEIRVLSSDDKLILAELNAMFGRISIPANGNVLETLKALAKALGGK